MKSANLVLASLLILGVAVTTAFVANEISSEGTIEIESPENETEEAPEAEEEEPIDITFEETGEETRTADYDGATVEPGDTLSDEFVISNNHPEEFQAEFESCQGYEKTYFVGPNFDETQEVEGEFFPSAESDIFVQVEIEIPEDAEAGQQNLCTDIIATPV